MKMLEAKGKDDPASDQGAPKLTFQATGIRLCRYFVLSDPHITVNSYSLQGAACSQYPVGPKI